MAVRAPRQSSPAPRVDELPAAHKPPPLPDAVARQLDEILARAAAAAGLSPG